MVHPRLPLHCGEYGESVRVLGVARRSATGGGKHLMRPRFARRLLLGIATLLAALSVGLGAAQSARAASLPGAIFTTLANGSEVNFNIFPSKDAVYLDGGP